MATYNMGYDPNTGGYNTSFWTPEQWQKFGASGGTIGANGEVITGTGNVLTSDQLRPVSLDTDSMLGLSSGQWGTLSNLGGLALKAAALPSQINYYDAQTGLAEQQLASNKQAMADRNTFNTNWANASNNLTQKA